MKPVAQLFFLTIMLPWMAHAQFTWLNPKPQANTLNTIIMTDSLTVLAAGDAGTIMKSNDQGSTWEILPKPSIQNINDLCFVGQMFGYVVGDSGLVVKTIDAGNSWTVIETGVETHLDAVFFADELTGWVAGMNGLIMRTADGGNSWESSKFKFMADFADLYFFDGETGFAVGEHESGKGIIIKTINSGKSWDLISDQIDEALFCVIFTDENTGFAAGNFSHLVKTMDGGHTWQPVENPNQGFNYHIYDVLFTGESVGYTCGVFGSMMKTMDGGDAWINIETGLEELQTLNALTVFDGDQVFASGLGGMMIRSDDAGQSFEKLLEGSSNNMLKICHPDDSHFFVVGDGVQLKSGDAGQSWETNVFTELDYLIDAQFINTNLGFAFTYDGIFKTIDSGDSWFLVQPLSKASWMTSMTMANENLGFIMGGGQSPGGATWGTIMRTTDGTNWVGLNSPASSALNDACFTDDTHCFLIGRNGQLFETLNAGDSWTTIDVGTDFHLNKICMVTASTGFIIATYSYYQNQILKTTDGGQSWQIIFSYTDFYDPVRLNAIDFYDSLNIMVAGINGYVLKTEDGGVNWKWQERFTSTWFEDILMINDSSGILAGQYGALISFGDFSAGTYVEKPALASGLAVYPNPVVDQISLRFNPKKSQETAFQIFNANGRQVFERNLSVKPGSQNISITLPSNLSPGIYFYLFEGEHFLDTGKIIKAIN